MERYFVACLLALYVVVVSSQCPHEDPTLLDWNDTAAWKNGQVPIEGTNATLIGNVLWNVQSTTLLTLTIAPGAKLVFDPNTDIQIKVQAIYVDGELHIGSESCPFLNNTHITFYGNVGQDKVLLVRAGGTLEIHGMKKLPWTKLANTAPKLENGPGVISTLKDIEGLASCKRGLILYQINPENGTLEDSAIFDFDTGYIKFKAAAEAFVKALTDIPDGKIVGLAIRKTMKMSHRNYDFSDIFEAIEILASDEKKKSPIRNVDQGSAYALLTEKGNTDRTVEAFEANVGKRHSVKAQAIVGDLAIILESVVDDKASGCNNYAQMSVYLDEYVRPTITVLDNTDTWNIGDKLVLASTDFDYEQAEEVTIIDKPGPNKLRLQNPLKYTHYGEIYKGVDMRGEVGLLSRNVKIDSEDASTSDTYGGHIKVIQNFTSVHIEGAELENLGQQEVLGAYSVHFHMCEDVDADIQTRPWIKQNSIHHSNSRCVTVHGTHGLIVQENVCYGTLGHSYFLEDGGEKRTILDGNLGLGTHLPPKGKGLIPTDTDCPTTFWVTNPITYARNNVAAGSYCRAYWYNFPDIPLGPSADKGFMQEFEAKYTAIAEFENNVAHSNRGGGGLFIDNILRPNGDSHGYNQYRPMKDPVTNKCWEDESKCEDECVLLNRFTGYKNSPSNVWVRGGCLNITQCSISDALIGVQFLSDDNGSQRFMEKSIVIGDSPNYGEPEEYLTEDSSIQRSFPFGVAPLRRSQMHLGIEYLNKAMYIFDTWFGDFVDNEHYKMGAIGWRQNNRGTCSPRSGVKGLKFGFTDPDEGNRVNDYHPDDVWYTSADGDDVSNVRDMDGSLTGLDYANCDKTYTVVKPDPLHLTGSCKSRDNWEMAWCCEHYGEAIVMDLDGKDNDMKLITLTRDDDYLNRRYDSDDRNNAPYLIILGGEYSYTAFFNKKMPEKIAVTANGVTNSGYVRFAFCIPPKAKFELKTFSPKTYNGIKYWTRVDSLSKLDEDTTGGKYFYHKESGYFATIMRNAYDFDDDEYSDNPQNKKVFFQITILKGNRRKVNCLAAAHKALNGLAPKKSTKKSMLSMLKELLLKYRIRSKRSATTETKDTRTLQFDSRDPPAEWGAGSTHVPRY